MAGPFLYSTNVFLKLLIQEKYMKDTHYIWCSEYFDSNTNGRHSFAACVGASSNPASIYKDLHAAVISGDLHCSKIVAQRAGFKKLAQEWFSVGKITENDRDDIFYLADNSSITYWRPLLYVVSRPLVESRLTTVPARERASIGNEFIIKDLSRTEFDVIEF